MKKTLTKLKKIAWDLLSKIRRLEEADDRGMVECITCNKIYFWKDIQAGHFIDGRGLGILYDERGIHPQCYACNCPRHGLKTEYYPYMLKRYGQEVIDELKRNAKNVVKMYRADYEEKIAQYKIRLNELLKTRGQSL